MSEPLKITVLTDIHYCSKKIWVDGTPYKFPPKNDQQFFLGSEEIINSAFKKITDDSEREIVLISGDITHNGELSSHEEILHLLYRLKESGKRVFVTTATHDYRDGESAYGYDRNNQKVAVPCAKRSQLADMYRDFGIADSIAYYEPSMSYVAQLSENCRLLALNDDKGYDHAGFTDEHFTWISEQVKKAHDDGQFIFAMTHHPVLAPTPLYSLIGPHDMVESGDMRAMQLADMGVNFIFTGHTHVHNISLITSERGNVFYDIATASTCGFPCAYRYADIYADENKIALKTEYITNADGLDLGGKTLTEYTKHLFLGFIGDVFDAAENDYEKFTLLAQSFSIKPEKSKKLKFIIRRAAKFLNHLTFGKVWKHTKRYGNATKDEIAPIYDKKVLPFVIDVAANLFKGDADCPHSSPEYKIAYGFLKYTDKKVRPFRKKLIPKLGTDKLSEVILPLICKDGICDREGVLQVEK